MNVWKCVGSWIKASKETSGVVLKKLLLIGNVSSKQNNIIGNEYLVYYENLMHMNLMNSNGYQTNMGYGSCMYSVLQYPLKIIIKKFHCIPLRDSFTV